MYCRYIVIYIWKYMYVCKAINAFAFWSFHLFLGSIYFKFPVLDLNRCICLRCYSHLHVGGVPLTVSPRAGNGWKGAVRMIKFVVIGTKEKCSEGLLKKATETANTVRHHIESQDPHPVWKSSQSSTSSWLICVLIATLVVNVALLDCQCSSLNSLNYLHYFIVVLFYSREQDQSLIVSKPEGEYSKL